MNPCKEKGNVCRMGYRWKEQVVATVGIFCYVYDLITRISSSDHSSQRKTGKHDYSWARLLLTI